MTQKTALKHQPSLLERAAQVYDFGSALKVAPPIDLPPAPRPVVEPLELAEPVAAPAPAPRRESPHGEPAPAAARAPGSWMDVETPEPAPALLPAPRPRRSRGPVRNIDREALRGAGYILPDAAVSGLAEEFRLVKRRLLRAVESGVGNRSILVASAQPDEGKTFCALNLALSLASERDFEVLLIDGDFSKPEIPQLLGLDESAGLVDALEDPSLDPEELVIATDLGGLCVLPAGRQANNVPELLASEQTREVLARLTADPRRIVIFDSPPVLAASSAAILAAHVGQVMMVVRADRTTEADLREAAGLLSACDELSLLLNGAGFAATGRRYGHYNGYGK